MEINMNTEEELALVKNALRKLAKEIAKDYTNIETADVNEQIWAIRSTVEGLTKANIGWQKFGYNIKKFYKLSYEEIEQFWYM